MPSDEGTGVKGVAADGLIFQGRSIRSWAEMLCDGDITACRSAAEALDRLGLEFANVLTALSVAGERQSSADNALAMANMGRLGVRLLGVIPRFRAALRSAVLTNKDENGRTSALHALTLLGPQSISQVPP